MFAKRPRRANKIIVAKIVFKINKSQLEMNILIKALEELHLEEFQRMELGIRQS